MMNFPLISNYKYFTITLVRAMIYLMSFLLCDDVVDENDWLLLLLWSVVGRLVVQDSGDSSSSKDPVTDSSSEHEESSSLERIPRIIACFTPITITESRTFQ